MNNFGNSPICPQTLRPTTTSTGLKMLVIGIFECYEKIVPSLGTPQQSENVNRWLIHTL